MKNVALSMVALATLMSPAESESASSGTTIEEASAATEAPAAAPAKVELKNSHWCRHPVHGLGMIGEIGSQVTFHRFRTHSGEAGASLDSEPVICELADLKICKADELPPHLGYTEEQLVDLGYSQ